MLARPIAHEMALSTPTHNNHRLSSARNDAWCRNNNRMNMAPTAILQLEDS